MYLYWQRLVTETKVDTACSTADVECVQMIASLLQADFHVFIPDRRISSVPAFSAGSGLSTVATTPQELWAGVRRVVAGYGQLEYVWHFLRLFRLAI